MSGSSKNVLAGERIGATQPELPTSGPIQIRKLSHLVADHLRAQIVSGKLKAGSRLPAEADLINAFKVSRPTLRETLRILEAEGLLSVGRGARSGATVRAPSVERSAHYAALVLSNDGTTMGEIQQVRMLLEPPLVRALASSPDRSVVKLLRQAVEREVVAMSDHDPEAALLAINQFHALLIRQSVNPVVGLLARMLHALSSTAAAFIVDGSGVDPVDLSRNIQATIAGHRRLVELIEGGASQKAEQFWSLYMRRAADFIAANGLGARPLRLDADDDPRDRALS